MKDLKDIKDLSNGHTVQELEPDKQAQYFKDFTGQSVRNLRINPGGWFLPAGYLQFEEYYSNFKFRPSDVLIMTHPKCGTTWTQEIVWTMKKNPNLDNPDAEKALITRSPVIELDMVMVDRDLFRLSEAQPTDPGKVTPLAKDFIERCPGKDPKDGMMLQMVEALKETRILKTHFPFSLLPKELLDTCKVIYVARNPKDTLLSFQHHCRLMKEYSFVGSQDDFVQYFVDGMGEFG